MTKEEDLKDEWLEQSHYEDYDLFLEDKINTLKQELERVKGYVDTSLNDWSDEKRWNQNDGFVKGIKSALRNVKELLTNNQ